MVDRIGQGTSLARAAIEAALKRQTETARRLSGAAEGASTPGAEPRTDFAQKITEGLRQVDDEVKKADQLVNDVVSGKVHDIHEVTAQLAQSQLSLRFALEVRNKFIDAYREVMRMSV
jgi:flagellar hook-basal body complex protein FliE